MSCQQCKDGVPYDQHWCVPAKEKPLCPSDATDCFPSSKTPIMDSVMNWRDCGDLIATIGMVERRLNAVNSEVARWKKNFIPFAIDPPKNSSSYYLMNNDNFMPWPKTARLSRNMVITEKIDGTNAQIYIHDERFLIDTEVKGVQAQIGKPVGQIPFLYSNEGIHIAAGSRTKWITPEQDNYGFARWVRDNAFALAALGHGRHFGEWWGQGIQRKYGLSEKRFSLFNTRRWCLHGTEPKPIPSNNPIAEVKFQQPLPEIVGLVPVLYEGPFSTFTADLMIDALKKHGSMAAPGFMNPEGICIFHEAAQIVFKKTIEDDANPKSA